MLARAVVGLLPSQHCRLGWGARRPQQQVKPSIAFKSGTRSNGDACWSFLAPLTGTGFIWSVPIQSVTQRRYTLTELCRHGRDSATTQPTTTRTQTSPKQAQCEQRCCPGFGDLCQRASANARRVVAARIFTTRRLSGQNPDVITW